MQGFIEPLLFLVAGVLLWSARKETLSTSDKRVLVAMVLISLVSQLVLFWFVLPYYSGEKIPVAVALGLPVFYGLEVYVVTRLALIYTPALRGGGFALQGARSQLWPWAGLGGAVVAIGLIVVYSLALGQRFFPDRPSLLMGLGAGFTNLAREEVLFRLGAQTMLAYALQKYRYGWAWAVAGSALLFELWHNPIPEVNGLNFLISFTFALLYHRWGYEAAALAHSLGDLAVFWVLPTMWAR